MDQLRPTRDLAPEPTCSSDIRARWPRAAVGVSVAVVALPRVIGAAVDQARAAVSSHGFTRLQGLVPASLCNDLVDALRTDLGVPVDDASRWAEYEAWDIVPVWVTRPNGR